jgi:hypothetical protein
MALVARFFIKDTDCAVDYPLNGRTLPQLMLAVRTDGFLIHDAFCIPLSEIHFVMTHDVGTGQVLPFSVVPNPEKPA